MEKGGHSDGRAGASSDRGFSQSAPDTGCTQIYAVGWRAPWAPNGDACRQQWVQSHHSPVRHPTMTIGRFDLAAVDDLGDGDDDDHCDDGDSDGVAVVVVAAVAAAAARDLLRLDAWGKWSDCDGESDGCVAVDSPR